MWKKRSVFGWEKAISVWLGSWKGQAWTEESHHLRKVEIGETYRKAVLMDVGAAGRESYRRGVMLLGEIYRRGVVESCCLGRDLSSMS